MFSLVLPLLFLFRVDASCLVTSNSTRQPVYLRNESGKYDLVVPKSDGIQLLKGEALVLLCPGHLNRLNQSNSNITTAICVSDDKFVIGKKVYQFGDLECRRGIRGSVQNTNIACHNGLISNIGYHVHDQFLRLIEVCYDENNATTIYTRHTLFGGAIGHGEFSMPHHRPSFNTKGLPQRSKAVSLMYHIEAQKSRLSSLLLSSILANNYITNKTFLAKGHLSPVADFMFQSWQDTTYFFLNVCPQWQIINAANWQRVENMVRKLAKNAQENLQVITGTHEVLELSDRYGNMKKLYLSQRGPKFPVPKFIWKIVYSEKSRRAIVLVAHNNPYALNTKPLCTCICDINGWSATEWTHLEKGYVHCCNYTHFKQIVRNVPHLQVSGVLQGPICKFPTKQLFLTLLCAFSRMLSPTDHGGNSQKHTN